SLNMLCVRLVFCLYAEDAGIFGGHLKFHNYIKSFNVKDVRRALIDLFRVLDTKPAERDPYMDDALAAFPYVNGGLFADENIEIPNMTQDIVDLLLHNASEDFDWSQISPTIFGAVFESTLNPETRRSGGMHYTSIENIHKVIDPLFLDELREELAEIKVLKVPKIRNDKAEAFREKLSKLTFFDPACGSGNFLTETYISLRRLENEALEIINQGQILLGFEGFIKVSIGQFYGIEINDFAVTVAKTALWIAESQMLKETEDIVNMSLDFLPLKSYANIVEGNALRTDWESVVPKDKLNYIMGNPPFVGYSHQTKEQKMELMDVLQIDGKTIKSAGKLDYVVGWYYKAINYIEGTRIECAFVSTNSIAQGEQPEAIWKPLMAKYNLYINFAYQPFKWKSESAGQATVHCVIIGFSFWDRKTYYLFGQDIVKKVDNISTYLLPTSNIFIEKRSKPLCKVPEMMNGNRPTDDGALSLSVEELNENYSTLPSYIKPFVGSKEYLYNQKRYCFWVDKKDLSEIKNDKFAMSRFSLCRDFREKSTKEGTRKCADTPYLFQEIRQPEKDFVVLPVTTSEQRKYIPIGYLSKDIICSNALMIIPNADIYHFGVLISNVHMAWMRAFTGRLEMRYQYSASVVYNNFPWCTPSTEQKKKIEETAQAILDARTLYPKCSLSDLYSSEMWLYPELLKAHQANDRAVMQAYGFDVKTMTESTCVAELMKMYQELVK
ncbi:MAG: class I SAM-dependent DNA methyltransferase, partial [Clostridia bacterium]|nr:class I SAM-dependent DNA methyltransferase [Clostridia bacterium]